MIGLLMLAGAAEALTICADRPGQATGTCTVPKGHVQIETGLADWSVQKSGGARDTLILLGETTIKYGLDERSNLEVDISPFQRSSVSGEQVSGVGDLGLLYKYRLTSADAPVQVAILPSVKIPVAKRPLGNGKVEAGLLVPASFAIGNSPFSIGLTPELDWAADGDGHGHHPAMVQVASLGWQVTDTLALSGEVWSHWDWDPAGMVKQASTDMSAALLATSRIQLDAGANVGLNRETPDVELYAGFSVLF